jgi:uncharacterized membrane protein
MIDKLIYRFSSKSGNIQKCSFCGLLIFVAIPLPGTGVWSGALAAALLDMCFKLTFPAILIGNMISRALIMGFSHGFMVSV